MRDRINSIEELEVIGIDTQSEEAQETLKSMQEYWNRDIEVYCQDTCVSGLYEIYNEGGIFLGHLIDEDTFNETFEEKEDN